MNLLKKRLTLNVKRNSPTYNSENALKSAKKKYITLISEISVIFFFL